MAGLMQREERLLEEAEQLLWGDAWSATGRRLGFLARRPPGRAAQLPFGSLRAELAAVADGGGGGIIAPAGRRGSTPAGGEQAGGSVADVQPARLLWATDARSHVRCAAAAASGLSEEAELCALHVQRRTSEDRSFHRCSLRASLRACPTPYAVQLTVRRLLSLLHIGFPDGLLVAELRRLLPTTSALVSRLVLLDRMRFGFRRMRSVQQLRLQLPWNKVGLKEHSPQLLQALQRLEALRVAVLSATEDDRMAAQLSVSFKEGIQLTLCMHHDALVWMAADGTPLRTDDGRPARIPFDTSERGSVRVQVEASANIWLGHVNLPKVTLAATYVPGSRARVDVRLVDLESSRLEWVVGLLLPVKALRQLLKRTLVVSLVCSTEHIVGVSKAAAGEREVEERAGDCSEEDEQEDELAAGGDVPAGKDDELPAGEAGKEAEERGEAAARRAGSSSSSSSGRGAGAGGGDAGSGQAALHGVALLSVDADVPRMPALLSRLRVYLRARWAHRLRSAVSLLAALSADLRRWLLARS
eukprot:PLAT14790.1.p1 GENE.PLAT14790.1~~PLAT14790.1.p1  ORF type:complete len:599 (+),score=304.64 PLAT14790.1:211-1797(+)